MIETERRQAERQERNVRFISYLRHLIPDDEQRDGGETSRKRAVLAQLRRGLGKEPGIVPDMYPHVESFLPLQASAEDEAPYYLVAALFAWHPKDWIGDRWRTNLGASLAQLRRKQAVERNTAVEPGDSTERRFVAMLSSTREDLAYHLRQMIGLLRTKEVPVNWLQLLPDIQDWNADSRFVQRRWASAFWGQTVSDQPTDATSGSNIPEGQQTTGNNSATDQES